MTKGRSRLVTARGGKWIRPTLTSSNTFFGPYKSAPNGISINSAFYSAHERDQQTDRPRYSVCSNRPLSLANAAIRSKNRNISCNDFSSSTGPSQPIRVTLHADDSPSAAV